MFCGGLGQKFSYLRFMQKQFPGPHGVRIIDISELVRRYMHVVYKNLAAINSGKALIKAYVPPRADLTSVPVKAMPASKLSRIV